MIQIQELDRRVDAGSVNQGEKAWAMEKDTRKGQLKK